MIRLAVRAHDIPANSPEELCTRLAELGVRDIQLVAHKSFPGFVYSDDAVRSLSAYLRRAGVRVAVYGCYIDPATEEGRVRFVRHIRWAAMMGAEAIATETGVAADTVPCEEGAYREMERTFRMFAHEAVRFGVRAAVETVGVHPISTPQQTKRLLDGAPGLAAVLDAENLRMHPACGDPAQQALDLYGDRVAAVHWKAYGRGEDEFLLDWLRSRPDVPLVTEGLTGDALEQTLNALRE